MAITVTIDKKRTRYSGSERKVRGTANLGVYATNGIAVTARQLGLHQINSLDISPSGGIVFQWDRANGKIKAFKQAGITENVAGAYTQNAVIAQVALVEVSNAVDITATSFEFDASGV